MRIICVGDCGVDRYLNLECDRPGGITLNFAVNIKECLPPTASVGVVTAVGTDSESRIVVDAIERFGLKACISHLEGQTSIQYIDREPSGEKIFVRYEEGVLGRYRVGAGERAVIAECDVLVAPVYAQIVGLFDSVMDAPSSGMRVVDFGDLSDYDDRTDIVSRYIGRFHLAFFGLQRTEVELIDHLDRLARASDRLLVVTLGAEGSIVLGNQGRKVQPAIPVPRIVDTTGAGDAYAAGFVSEYIRSKDIRKSLRRGSEKAADSISRVGTFDSELVPWL